MVTVMMELRTFNLNLMQFAHAFPTLLLGSHKKKVIDLN